MKLPYYPVTANVLPHKLENQSWIQQLRILHSRHAADEYSDDHNYDETHRSVPQSRYT